MFHSHLVMHGSPWFKGRINLLTKLYLVNRFDNFGLGTLYLFLHCKYTVIIAIKIGGVVLFLFSLALLSFLIFVFFLLHFVPLLTTYTAVFFFFFFPVFYMYLPPGYVTILPFCFLIWHSWCYFMFWFKVDGGHRAIIFSRIGGIQDNIYTEGLHFRCNIQILQHIINKACVNSHTELKQLRVCFQSHPLTM